MQTTSRQYNYVYLDGGSGHHHAYLISPLLEMLSEKQLSSQRNLRILDLGCGNGSLSHLIAQQGYEVVGIEESESGINFARHSFPDCQFIQSSVYDLPYAELENSFDIVMAIEVIEHLFYPRELVRAAQKCLKPNGRLILSTPYHGYLKNLVLAGSGKLDKHFTALWDGCNIKFFSVNTISELLKTEGYRNISFKFAGRFPLLWKSLLCSSSPTKN
jgi:2-polyprenyl-3-methyl-5-hydroxy-6-metoxy-1,4-benzoquinol methylase